MQYFCRLSSRKRPLQKSHSCLFQQGPFDAKQQLTLEQKVGQLFLLCFRQDTDGTNLFTDNQAVRHTLHTIQSGGIVLFDENIHTVAQVRLLIQNMQKNCRLRPFIGIDPEGGTVQHIHKTSFIHAADVPSMW